MKKFLIAGSSLAAVAAAGSAGAVDVTLGGSIDMGVEFGVGKSSSSLSVGDAYNSISLSLAAAGTTDGGMKYGGSFTLATAGELQFSAYDSNGTAAAGKNLVKMTVAGGADLEAAVYNVSGGQMIAASQVVGVKINSDWKSVGGTETGYDTAFNVDGGIDAGNVCKLAGIASAASGSYTRLGTDGKPANPVVSVAVPTTGYLPAGKLTTAATVTITAGASAKAGVVAGTAWDMLTADGAAQASVTDAAVYIGPFMEVKLHSSSTKMVVGAACVEGLESSDTNYFMNNASKVVTASDASIYIEGGFGKLTLQTGDYAGGVSAIGDAGDAADLEVNGLGVVIGGVGMLGANPFVAVDLAPNTGPNNFQILTGGTIDMGGLSAAIDVSVSSADVVDIQSWDLGLNYAMGDMGLAFAYDSGNDWGMSASMDVAGFGVDATIYNKAVSDHEKSGLFYSIAASTSLNGVGLSLGVDQDMQPTVNLSKSMGGLSIYAAYDAADEGGKVGATLSF
ncbi:MAG: hypothetical protein CBC49_008310 [Alphaproteobacteria bacterium TMED89]|nr:hypothetical protein [Rhodospirillaceae bacterium]RPH12363.1 MAG: hypothetical protein CBC49_008310 [Alphaproteobacteria bacterium TMED89]